MSGQQFVTTLFISDLHLDESRPKITAAFFHFLENHAYAAEALYILGDFFEAWIGDDEDSALSREVVVQLRRLSNSGVRLFIMHGNRDFLLGDVFAKQTGACLLADRHCIDLYGQKILLMHGDTLCTADTEYMTFRKQVRNPQWQSQLLAMPLEQRRLLAAQMRAQSREANQQNNMNNMNNTDIMDVSPNEVVTEMEKAGVQIFIHGHTHRPQRHTLSANGKAAERIVLGDWEENLWYVQANSTEAKSNDPKLELIESGIDEI